MITFIALFSPNQKLVVYLHMHDLIKFCDVVQFLMWLEDLGTF